MSPMSPQHDSELQAHSRSSTSLSSMATARQSRGELARGYESRFGSPMFQESPPCITTPRAAKKPGLTTFTDPHNPFARTLSKQMTNVEDVRCDTDRAGTRTRTPGVIPFDFVANTESRARTAPHRYGNHEWRPSKRCPDATPRSLGDQKTPRSSEGVGDAMTMLSLGPKISVLENYLNDMKRCRTSLRVVPAPHAGSFERLRDEDYQPPPQRRLRARSASVERQVESRSDSYGFPKKRSVSGYWTTRGSREMLNHPELVAAKKPHEERLIQASARFEQMVAHIKESTPELRRHVEHFKARNLASISLHHDNTPVRFVAVGSH